MIKKHHNLYPSKTTLALLPCFNLDPIIKSQPQTPGCSDISDRALEARQIILLLWPTYIRNPSSIIIMAWTKKKIILKISFNQPQGLDVSVVRHQLVYLPPLAYRFEKQGVPQIHLIFSFPLLVILNYLSHHFDQLLNTYLSDIDIILLSSF